LDGGTARVTTFRLPRPATARHLAPRAGADLARLRREWVHCSGGVVRHCGHPTALRPWYGLPPGGYDGDRNQLLLTGGFGLGLAFRRVADCKTAVLTQIARNIA
jgi:hypothetical protein